MFNGVNVPYREKTIDIDLLFQHPKHYNIYGSEYHDAEFRKMKEKIRKHGIFHKPVVNQKYEIISGFRRIMALKELGFDKVKVDVVYPKKDQIQEFEDSEEEIIVEYNIQRKKLWLTRVREIKILYPELSKRHGKRNKFLDKKNKKLAGKKTRDIIAKEIKSNGKYVDFLYKLDIKDPDAIDLLESLDQGDTNMSAAIASWNYHHKEDAGSKPKDNKRQQGQKQIKVKVKEGEDYQVWCKSCKDLTEIPDDSVDIIVTSPPYGPLIKYSNLKDDIGNMKFDEKEKEWMDAFQQIFTKLYNVSKITSNFYLNVSDFRNKKTGELFDYPDKLKRIALGCGFKLNNTIIYHNKNPKSKNTPNSNPSCYEFIFHFVKDLKDHWHNPAKIPTKEGKPKIFRKPRNHGGSFKGFSSNFFSDGWRDLPNFWYDGLVVWGSGGNVNLFEEYKVTKKIKHPAVFPEAIPVIALYQGAQPGNTLLDPFMGSGLALEIGLRMGLKVKGLDTNPLYFRNAAKVLEKVVRKKKRTMKNPKN
jgi:site-specific DNA-methyltransferase (adenine-specific)